MAYIPPAIATQKSYLLAASANPTLVVGGSHYLVGLHLANTTSSPMFLKLYDSASAPTAGSGTPVRRVPIPANLNGGGNNFVPVNIQFNNGIAFTVTQGIADNDATSISLTSVTSTNPAGVNTAGAIVNIDYI